MIDILYEAFRVLNLKGKALQISRHVLYHYYVFAQVISKLRSSFNLAIDIHSNTSQI